MCSSEREANTLFFSARTLSNMPHSLFQRVVVPVANEDDAEATTAALAPYVDAADGTVIAVHVIEKAGGAPDKASVTQRELAADKMFEIVADSLSHADVELETEYLYGTDIAETIIEGAHDQNASAIVFTPRGESRWLKLLTGDVATKLLNESDIPVIVLPDTPTEDTSTESTDP